MYFHHPVIKKIQTITSNEIIKSIKCSFKVPHTDFEHYRYKKKNLEVGPYSIREFILSH